MTERITPKWIEDVLARGEAATEGPWLTPEEAADGRVVEAASMIFAYKARTDLPALATAYKEAMDLVGEQIRLQDAYERELDRIQEILTRLRDLSEGFAPPKEVKID